MCAGAAIRPTPAAAQAEAGQGAEPAAPAPASAYEVAFVGEMELDLRQRLEAASQLRALSGRPPTSPAALRRRIDDDLQQLAEVLRSEGFYGHILTADIDNAASPVRITLHVDTGIVYLVGEYRIEIRGEPIAGAPELPEDVGLTLGMRARAESIRDAERLVLARLGELGRPFATVAEAGYVVDHSTQLLSAHLAIDPGPASTFGPLALRGLQAVSEAYIRRLAAWAVGAPYQQSRVAQMRQRLADTGLFTSIVVEHADAPDPDGRIPVTVVLEERLPRTVGAGLSFTSARERVIAKVSWEHRNLRGEGERLRAEALGSKLRQEAAVRLRRPNFAVLDQALLAQTTLAHERSDAFDERAVGAELALERRLDEGWSAVIGAPVEASSQSASLGSGRFLLTGARLALTYDGRDDVLNPTRGTVVSFAATPWLSLTNQANHFLTTEVAASAYASNLPGLGPGDVIAVRGRLAGNFFAETARIPPNKRLYAGGGGSIRGYEFRAVGPLDRDSNPVGGRSLTEVSTELRLRHTEQFGSVLFVDAGQVSDGTFKQFGSGLRMAAGLGLRYFTAIGPFRFDLAFPLRPRKGIDSTYAFYLSLGQAF